MTKFCSALYLENLLTNIFAKLNLRGGVSCMPAALLFTHIETNQSVGGAKTAVPGEKPPDTPASRTWLVSHMNSCPVRGANPHR